MRALCALALGIAVAACSTATAGSRSGEAVAIEPGRPFDLKVGQAAAVAEDHRELIGIVFASVLEDSRCPKGVQCIVAGKARIALEVRLGDQPSTTLELGTQGDAAEAEAGDFQIRLDALLPLPVEGRATPPENYLASLVVLKR